MPFVERNSAGKIIALHVERGDHCTEEVSLNESEILEFLGTHDGATQTLLDLSKSDMEMARVVEDLVNVLILKGVISEHDLPRAALEKLEKRQTWRGSLDEALAMFGGGKVI